jgi:hypothetical protein
MLKTNAENLQNPLEYFGALYHDVKDRESAYTPQCLLGNVVTISKTN